MTSETRLKARTVFGPTPSVAKNSSYVLGFSSVTFRKIFSRYLLFEKSSLTTGWQENSVFASSKSVKTSWPFFIEIILDKFEECLRKISISRITVLKEDETKSVLTFRVFVLFLEVKLSTEFWRTCEAMPECGSQTRSLIFALCQW